MILSPLHARLQAIDHELSELQRERAEVEGAIKVFERYAPMKAHDVVVSDDERNKSEAAPRPEGIPTIWEMTEVVLEDAEENTLSIDDIVSSISDLWWPGVTKPQIAPTIYGFAKEKDGRLERPGRGLFRLSKKEEPSDDKLGGRASEGSLFNSDPEAQGGKATPGGGP